MLKLKYNKRTINNTEYISTFKNGYNSNMEKWWEFNKWKNIRNKEYNKKNNESMGWYSWY